MKIIEEYQSKYKVEFFGDLAVYACQPYPQLFMDLQKYKNDEYPNDCRFVFLCTADVDDSLFFHLQRVLFKLEIPNFFVILVTNNQRANELLEQARADLCPTESQIQVDVLDLPLTQIESKTNFNIPDTICVTPWINVEVTNLGKYKPCCEYNTAIQLNANEHTVTEAYNSIEMRELRAEFLGGKCPAGCSRCFDDESLGKVSKRMRDNFVYRDVVDKIDWYKETDKHISSLDIKLGNTCNLKCRICSPISSSKWNAEVVNNPTLQPFYYVPPTKPNWVEDPDSVFWSSIKELKNELKHIDFAGGEPLLIKSHYQLLKYLVEQNVSENIALHYNTNGTVFDNDLVKLWDKFKHVTLTFSIDNVNEKFEYERYGASWSEVDSNINRYLMLPRTQYSLDIYSTLSAFNVANAGDVYLYAKFKGLGVSYNWLVNPNALSVDTMPEPARKYAIECLKSVGEGFADTAMPIIKRLQQTQKSPTKLLLDTIDAVDQVRKQKFSDVYPELNRILR